MRKKINLALITIGIVIAGVILVTEIARFNNRNKTEVKDNQTSTSISEQVETPETSTESDIEIIEDETSISDDGLTSSNAGGSLDPVEVEITEDGVVADKPEPYPDEYSQINQPEDKSDENSAESGVIKDVGNSIDLNGSDEEDYFVDDSEIKTELPSGGNITEEEKQAFIDKVKSYGTTLH